MTHEQAARTVLGSKVMVRNPRPGKDSAVGEVCGITYPFSEDPQGDFLFEIETEDGDYLLDVSCSRVEKWKKQDWSPRTGS